MILYLYGDIQNEYLSLVDMCMIFACELMDLCRGTQEVEAILSEGTSNDGQKGGDPLARLKMALEYEEKKVLLLKLLLHYYFYYLFYYYFYYPLAKLLIVLEYEEKKVLLFTVKIAIITTSITYSITTSITR